MKNSSSTPTPSTGLATVQTVGQGLQPPHPGTGLTVLDTVNKQDIVAIIRSEAEDRLGLEHADANKQLSKLNARLVILNAELDKLAQEAVKGVDLEASEAAAIALNQVFGMKAEATVELTGRDDDRKRFNLTISVVKPGCYGDGKDTIGAKEVTIPYSSAAIDLLKEIKLVQKDIKSVQTKLIEIKREVSNLPALERRAHAELAKSVLAGSKDGQALLQRLRLTARPIQTVEVEAA